MSYAGFLERPRQVQPAAVILGDQDENGYHFYHKWADEKRGITIHVPPGIMDLSNDARTCEDIMCRVSVPLTPSDVENIEKATKGQKDCREWSTQSQERLKSIFKDFQSAGVLHGENCTRQDFSRTIS